MLSNVADLSDAFTALLSAPDFTNTALPIAFLFFFFAIPYCVFQDFLSDNRMLFLQKIATYRVLVDQQLNK